jgi:hypothetical protein
LSTGPKLTGVEYHAALRVAPTPATVTEKQTKMLNDTKEAEAARMLHHFNVLSFDGLRRAVRVAQVTASAYARPACTKRGLTVYSRVQQRTKTILDMIPSAGADPTKPAVIALGRNYKGMCGIVCSAW